MLVFLANLSVPAFYIGMAIAIACTIWVFAIWIGSIDDRVGSDDWIVSQTNIKRGIIGIIVGAVLIAFSYGVDGVEQPYIRTVEKVVKRDVMPTYVQLYDKCNEDLNIKGDSPGSSKRFANMQKCKQLANEQMVILKEGPVRTITRTKKEVAYKKLPFKTFMDQCGAKSRASGKEAMEALERIHDRCLKASSTYMRGLVQEANRGNRKGS